MSLDFAEYNFNEIVSQLTTKLKEREDVWDNQESSTVRMLIELFAYVGEMLMYTAERRAQESYLETAQLRSSVINLVRLINYQPRRVVSATGTLQFSIASAHSKNIYIPKYTECQRTDGTKFLTNEDVILYAGETSVSVAALQGELIDLPFTSDGSENQEIAINDTQIENSNLRVIILEDEWDLVSSFVSSTSSDKHFKTVLNNDDTLFIRFGDGKFGKIPTNAATINVQYVRSAGADGNVYSTGIITTLNDTISDEDGTAQTMTVTNTSKFLGGSDVETIDEIKYNAPRIFATAERIVTKADYIAELEDYPGVKAVNVWGENEETPPNYDMFNKIRIAMLLDDWNLAGATFKQTISDFLETKAQLTVQYEFVDPTIVQMNAIVNAKTANSNSLSDVQSNIESTLDTQFALGTIDIGDAVRHADIVKAIEDTIGVSYHDLIFEIIEDIGVGDGAETEFSSELEMKKVRDGSLKLYDGSDLVAVSESVHGKTTAYDLSTTGHTVQFIGSAKLDTTRYKFGLASANLGQYATAGIIRFNDHSDFDFAGGIWSVELQVYLEYYKNMTLFRQDTDGNNYVNVYITSNGAIGITVYVGGSLVISQVSAAGVVPVGSFVHIEVSENGDDYYFFVNGVLALTFNTTERLGNFSGSLDFGSGISGYLVGNLDEIRFSKLLARHTASFAAPSSEYILDANTVLLTHLNGKGALREYGGSGVTGTLDYSSGELDASFVTPPDAGNTISIRYRQHENENDLIPLKNQIVRLTEKTVTVEYAS